MAVDHRFIDYDLSEVPIDAGAGLIEQTDDELLAATSHIPLFSEEFPEQMVPRSQWRERALANVEKYRATTRQIYSQSRTSACVGFGIAQAFETRRTRLRGGDIWTPMSGMSLYKRIGRTLYSGAYIPDGINEAVTRGILPLDTEENEGKFDLTWGITDWSSRFPGDWEKTANKFRITKWARCYGEDEVMSAMLAGYTGVVGRDRHCVPYVYVDYDGYDPYIAYANSWSPQWGDRGFGYDSFRVFRQLNLYVIIEITAYVPEMMDVEAG